MNDGSTSRASAAVTTGYPVRLQGVLSQLANGSRERRAIDAGEIDAIIDYARRNVILFPAARRALQEGARARAITHSGLLANSLLAVLPHEEQRRLLQGLESVRLQLGAVLHEPGEALQFVYFPIDSVVCLIATVESHKELGVGLVGPEGMVGISDVLEANVSSVRALVAAMGMALRMEATCFWETLRQCPRLRHELYRYTDDKLTLARQALACNCFHSAEQRLARWLLMIGDHARSRGFFLTQEFLARMLGVRRVTVTQVASSLQNRALISYKRGNIHIVNRSGLEAVSCRCYRRLKDLHERTARAIGLPGQLISRKRRVGNAPWRQCLPLR